MERDVIEARVETRPTGCFSRNGIEFGLVECRVRCTDCGHRDRLAVHEGYFDNDPQGLKLIMWCPGCDRFTKAIPVSLGEGLVPGAQITHVPNDGDVNHPDAQDGFIAWIASSGSAWSWYWDKIGTIGKGESGSSSLGGE